LERLFTTLLAQQDAAFLFMQPGTAGVDRIRLVPQLPGGVEVTVLACDAGTG
jgi:hypothetical protein